MSGIIAIIKHDMNWNIAVNINVFISMCVSKERGL